MLLIELQTTSMTVSAGVLLSWGLTPSGEATSVCIASATIALPIVADTRYSVPQLPTFVPVDRTQL
jgi:hypothetical protein